MARTGIRTWRVASLVLVALAATVAATGCDPGISRADRQACGRLQTMVHALADNRSADAVAAYDSMIAAAAKADPTSRIGKLVDQMASVTDARVDESKLSMSQVPELAQQALAASGQTLAKLVRACDDAGVPVSGLDRAGTGA